MRRTEPTLKERIKVELMRQRVEMREARHDREMRTVFNSHVCPICGHGHMVDIICRKYRGSVCEKHCHTCEHHEPQFCHCLYQETEPIDARKWRLVYGCTEKAELWRGIYRRELIAGDPILSDRSHPKDGNWHEAREKLEAALAGCITPKYEIQDAPDENGDYPLIDADTGEIHPCVVKHLARIPIWACVEYLPAGA